MRRAPALLLGVCAIVGCSDDGSDAPRAADDDSSAVIITTTSAAPPPSRPVESSTPPSASSTVPAETATAPASSASTAAPSSTRAEEPDPVIAFEEVARLDRPVDLAWRPGDARLYVVEQAGRVTVIDPATSSTTVALDITDRTVIGGNEQGFLGLEFSPEGERAFVNYTDRNGDTVIAEYTLTPDGGIDVGSERVLLHIDQPYGNHNGGELEFGPDGMLYIGLGDGGSARDPERRAMDPSTLLGKLLRIDPTPDAEAGYVAPADNPYVGIEGAQPEVFAIGLRNPWKFTFDPATDDLWIADVGQNQMEEIDHVPAPDDGTVAGRGLNFGWSAFEGTVPINSDVDATGAVPPVLTYEHGADGCSISGGAVYRGAAIAGLDGDYVYADHCSGRVWALDLAAAENVLLADEVGRITAIVAGPDDELYVMDLDGPVRRIVPG